MSPIQQMLLGAGGAVATKTYVDDVFSTYVYKGNSTNGRAISTGVDMTEGGLVWTKVRDASTYHVLHDTVNTGKFLQSQSTDALITSTTTVTGFSSTGYTLGTDSAVNHSNNTYASWTFRKAPGFFDVVTWTGNGTAGRTISHNLGSVPGCIMVKCTSTGNNWGVYHRSTKATHYLQLNTTNAAASDSGLWNNVEPTATNFTLGDGGTVNDNGETYVAYLFAGGESTAATAVSVDFNGSSQYLSIPDSTDYEFGSGDFTVECWLKADSFGNKNGLVSKHYGGYSSWRILTDGSGASSTFKFIWMDSNGNENTVTGGTVERGQWTHVAVSRSGNTIRMFVNGLSNGNVSFNNTIRDGDTAVLIGTEYIGSSHANQYYFDGKISNVRIVKGTGVYTSSFKPSTTALTSITNTKLLCCQSSTVTTATTSTGSITNNGAAASTDSPFDDPAGFVFGDAEDQNVIKCGSYVGNGSTDGPEIFLGFEPQYILIKRSSASESWMIFDAMRGMTTQAGNDHDLRADLTNSENDVRDYIDITPTGFKQVNTQLMMNGNGDTYIYMCIRRPDGYVGKPVELGTGVFNVALGNSNGSPVIPVFAANFPVDFALRRRKDAVDDWDASARLTQGKRLKTNTTDAESGSASADFDSNVGWNDGDFDDRYPSWMWKRHAGFDCICFKGDEVSGRQIPHSLNKTPEMVWVKARSYSESWAVYHKGLNGGTNPEQYYIYLDSSNAEAQNSGLWNNTAPTSTAFTLGNLDGVNKDNQTHIAMLFASVDGISKVGSYTGNGTSNSSSQEIVTGFAPRFLIVKKTSGSAYWVVLDTLRGWGSGDDKWLQLNDSAAQGDFNWGYPGPTGFVVRTNDSAINANNEEYIYYAHA